MSYQKELDLAFSAAKLAKEALFGNESAKKSFSSEGHDIKLKGDLLAEKAILDFLQEKSEYGILSEESGEVSQGKSPSIYWVVDPLDGSFNFNRNIPFYACSIGLWHKSDGPLLGVTYDLAHDHIYSAIIGEKPEHQVSDRKDLSDCTLATGMPVYNDFSDEVLQKFFQRMQKFKKNRFLGSAALSLAYVANGSMDVYFEDNIKLWDVAAGLALIKAAGGSFKFEVKDSDPHLLKVLATNKALDVDKLWSEL